MKQTNICRLSGDIITHLILTKRASLVASGTAAVGVAAYVAV